MDPEHHSRGLQRRPRDAASFPVEAEIPTIKEIFRLYAEKRLGCRNVAKDINARGMRRRSGALYSYKTIADILSNPVYIGTVIFRDIEVEDAHPAIIDRKTFDEAQRLMIERGENPAAAAGAASEYHLTGKIICPLYGHTYLGTAARGKTKTYRYYTCWTRNRYGTEHCPAPRINADRFDDIVLAALSDFYLNNTDLMMEAIRNAQAHHESIRSELEAELASVQAKIIQKDQAVDRYLTDYEEGAISKEIIERRVNKISDELTDLRHNRDRLQFQLDSTPGSITKTELKSITSSIAKIVNTGQVPQRKALCDLALDKIEINTATSTATPTFRVDIAHALGTTNSKSAPVEISTGAHKPSSQGVRERRPGVEPRGLEHPRTAEGSRHPSAPLIDERWLLVEPAERRRASHPKGASR
jgi:site-specific DNA recombinase